MMSKAIGYLNKFRQEFPQKKEFQGIKKDAEHQGVLKDLNKDKKLNIADALDDGVLTQKEFKALIKKDIL